MAKYHYDNGNKNLRKIYSLLREDRIRDALDYIFRIIKKREKEDGFIKAFHETLTQAASYKRLEQAYCDDKINFESFTIHSNQIIDRILSLLIMYEDFLRYEITKETIKLKDLDGYSGKYTEQKIKPFSGSLKNLIDSDSSNIGNNSGLVMEDSVEYGAFLSMKYEKEIQHLGIKAGNVIEKLFDDLAELLITPPPQLGIYYLGNDE